MLGHSRRLLADPPSPGDRHPTVADTLLPQFMISVACALVIIAFAGAESDVGELVRGWIEMTAGIVQMVFVLVPEPTPSTGTSIPSGVVAYRHILAANLTVAAVSFVGRGPVGRGGAPSFNVGCAASRAEPAGCVPPPCLAGRR